VTGEAPRRERTAARNVKGRSHAAGGTDEFILDAVRKERGVLGRLILALRVMLSAPRAAGRTIVADEHLGTHWV